MGSPIWDLYVSHIGIWVLNGLYVGMLAGDVFIYLLVLALMVFQHFIVELSFSSHDYLVQVPTEDVSSVKTWPAVRSFNLTSAASFLQ